MKRILPAIGAALMTCVSQGAGAIESDMTLDQFPSGRPASFERIDDARRGGPTEYGTSARIGALREVPVAARHGGGRYRTHGSFVEVSALGGAVEPGTVYGTAGTAVAASAVNAPGIIVINTGNLTDVGSLAAAIDEALYGGASGGLHGGAKVLNVEADRLDRRPYGANGLDVVYTGGAKIIRISPDFHRAEARAAVEEPSAPIREAKADVPPVAVYPDTDMADRPVDPPAERQAAATAAPATPAAEPEVAAPTEPPVSRLSELQSPPVPTPAPVPAPAEGPAAATPSAPAATGAYLEPWTPDWLRDCVARHPNFDASLGTYTNESGQRRFCTGEP